MSKVILSTDERAEIELIQKHIQYIEQETNSLKRSIEDKTPTGEKYTSMLQPESVTVSEQCTMILISLSDIRRYLATIERHTI